jgi:hypothetical protein
MMVIGKFDGDGVYLIGLVQDRDKWTAHVNVVMKLLAP